MSLPENGIELNSWSKHDLACNHCRVRNIRCGREHPQCANCIRNGLQCDFSDHGKWVNHMKLLINNINEFEARLASIEKELTRLTGAVRMMNGQPSTKEESAATCAEVDVSWAKARSAFLQLNDDGGMNTQSYQLTRHVVSGQDDTKRYHGPCTLLSLCQEFRARVEDSPNMNLKDDSGSQSPKHQNYIKKCQQLLTELCRLAGTEECLGLNQDDLQVFLPPKQFLLMACSTFFQLEDPCVDVFCQSTFWTNVDKIYSKPYTEADQSWALCFNTIILLVLDAEQPENGDNISSDSVIGSQFAIPFISNIRLALACPKILLLPKLINVQALALLSVAAQQYLEPSLASMFLAQACLLAKRMGLHQNVGDGIENDTEVDERVKVFRSLFLRDKTNLLSRGIHCWLPTFDCNLSFANDRRDDQDMNARIHLARLQEDIYRLVYSTESYRRSGPTRLLALQNIEAEFERWAELYGEPGDVNSTQPSDLRLGFLSSRIVALRSSSEIRHKVQVVKDSRRACQLLTASSDMSAANGLYTRSPSVEFDPLVSFSRSNSSKELSSLVKNRSRKPSAKLRSLAEGLSVPAFFSLASNIIWPVNQDDVPGDVRLLITVSQLFQDLDLRSPTDNCARKISRAFQYLLSIARILKPELFPQALSQTSHSTQLSKGSLAFVTFAPNMLSQSSGLHHSAAAYSGSQSSVYSTTNTTRTSTPSFDLLQPIDFGNGNGQYDLTPQYSASSDHVNKRQRLVIPTGIAASDETMNPSVFSHFPDMSPLMPGVDDTQEGTSSVEIFRD